MLRTLFLIKLLLLSGLVFSQTGKNTPSQRGLKYGEWPAYWNTNDERKENAFIVKVKPEFLAAFKSFEGQILMQKTLSQYGQVSSAPLFPTAKAPDTTKFYPPGVKPVDLSYIFEIKITSNLNLSEEDMSLMVMQTGWFQYAEPHYYPKTQSIPYMPDDPYAQPGASQQFYYLERIKLYDAWAIEKGNASIRIGIIDTGFDITHEDLVDNIAYNTADPINGLDDDGDGFTDNYAGWDVFSNDNDVSHTDRHGTFVAGIVGATADNGIGVAGVGFHCKIYPLKASPDGSNSIAAGYSAIIYGADQGLDVLNLSWGGAGSFSQTLQNVITYAAVNNDVVVVGAAGNTNEYADYYPASYDYSLSVTSSDTLTSPTDGLIDVRAFFPYGPPFTRPTYSHKVDLCAPGVKVWGPSFGNTYLFDNGTSFSAPIVSGAAGLVRAHYPDISALQAMELLRVTADTIYHFAENIAFDEQLGKGRLNVYRALTERSPAVRMTQYETSNSAQSKQVFSGDTVSLNMDFFNFLQATNQLQIELSANSSSVTFLEQTFDAGAIDSLQTKSNASTPFQFVLSENTPNNHTIRFRIGYTDAITDYQDYQYFWITVNPTWLDMDTNAITLTLSNSARFGYDDAPINSVGNGFTFNNRSLLYEGGLMIAISADSVSDNVRFNSGGMNNHFKTEKTLRYQLLEGTNQMATAAWSDSNNTTSRMGLGVEMRTYALHDSPDDQYIIVEYQFTNRNEAKTFDTLYAGLFCDWDMDFVTFNRNRADMDIANRFGYVYSTLPGYDMVGTAVISDGPMTGYSYDNGTIAGVNINPNGTFSAARKYQSLNGIGKQQAGMASGVGFDVAQTIGSYILDLKPGETDYVAFAFIAGSSVNTLRNQAAAARTKFKEINTSPTPVVTTQYLCRGSDEDIIISPENGQRFYFFNEMNQLEPIDTGSTYTLLNQGTSDTVWVKGADKLIPSAAVMAKVDADNVAQANFIASPSVLETGETLYLFSTATNSMLIEWNLGDGSSLVQGDNPTHTYLTPATYTIRQYAEDVHGCIDSLGKQVIVTLNTAILSPSVFNGNIQLHNFSGLADLQLLNAEGKIIVAESQTEISTWKYSTDLLAPGLYILRVLQEEKISTFKYIQP
jgi:serine protease